MLKLKILIIGAGVLGSNLAHSLKKGNDITIFARGKTYENLQNNGLNIKHKFGHQTIDYFKIIKKLEKAHLETKVYDQLKLSLLSDKN